MRRSRWSLLPVLAAVLLSACTSANTRTTDFSSTQQEVRATIQAALEKGGTSVSYAVIQDGNLLMADAVGYLDGSKQKAATVDTLFNIGSLSKVYTAAAVMKLVEAGKLGLDDPVVQHLPEFRLNDSRYADITVRMLLNHSSGMLGTDYTTGIVYGGYDEQYYDKLKSYFEKSVLKADPGKLSVYCNDGFEVAELLVAKVSGIPFDRFVGDNIFKPLGLSSAGYARRAFAPGSYAAEGTYPQEFPNVMGSGGISTNLIDLARFGAMFLAGGAGVLKPSSVAEMNLSQGKSFIAADTASTKFGLGWDSVDATFDDYDFGSGVIFKSGGTSQFTSYLYVVPAYKLSASISVTSDFSGDAATTLRVIIAKVLRAQGIETARSAAVYAALQPQPLPAGFETKYAGYYGANNSFRKVVVNSDQTISILQFDGQSFVARVSSLAFDGQDFAKPSGEKVCRFVEADGQTYLMAVSERQNKVSLMAQKLEAAAALPAAWVPRLDRLFLPAEVDFNAVYLMPGIKLVRQEGLGDLLFMQEGDTRIPLKVLDDQTTGIVLTTGRDLKTVSVETVNGEEWLVTEAYRLRPVASLSEAASGTVAIPADGANSLYRIPSGTLTFTVPENGRVIAYSDAGDQVYDSLTQGVDFTLMPKSGYVRFVGLPGVQFTVTVSP